MAEPLIIPVRLNDAAIYSAFNKIGASGKKATKEVKSGFDMIKQGVLGATDSVAGLMKAQMGLSAIKAAGSAIAASFSETSRYIMESAKNFQELRKSYQEFATLSGQANSSKFTIEEAQKGQASHLSPQEWRDFQSEFKNYAGSQIGGKNGKLTDAQGDEYGSRVAELMKGSGLKNVKIGAEMAGSLLENAQGPQEVEDLIQELTRGFNALEKGRVPLEQALPQMSRIMARGIKFSEAAQMFSVVAPAAPGEEGTSVENALKAIDIMKYKGTGAQYGVKPGMTDFESVKAFSANISARKQDLRAKGATEKMAQDVIGKELFEKEVVPDQREARGLIRGFGRQGEELGAFKTYGDIVADTPKDFEAQRKKRYEESDQGRQDAVDNALAVAKAKEGQRSDMLARRRQIAEVELVESKRMEEPSFLERSRGALPWNEDARTQQINRQMMARAHAELGESSGIGDNAAAANSGATDIVMRGLIERIEQQNKLLDQNNKLMEADAAGKTPTDVKTATAGSPPLTMPTTRPRGRQDGG
jgi:hypothetical protein